MSLQKAIREILLTETDLTDLVGGRIRPDELDITDDLPALIIEADSFTAAESLDLAGGSTGEFQFTVVCCGASRPAAAELEQIVRDTLDGYVGTVAGVTFSPITFSSIDYDHETGDDGGGNDHWFLNAVTFDAWIQ